MHNFIKYLSSAQGFLMGLSLIALADGAFAVTAHTSHPWEQTHQAVHELMHQEAEHLLQQQQKTAVEQASQTGHTEPIDTAQGCVFGCKPKVELLSLYGVGSEIFVQLRHEGREYLFAPGQKYPLGTNEGVELILQKVSGRCVDLLVAKEEVQQCLLPFNFD